ncbi:MAG TPA: alanine racemase [Gemmatimonadales bacterium]|nr:alanine racemase [Gemmatimonadales bacterium]
MSAGSAGPIVERILAGAEPAPGGASLESIETPAAVVDLSRLDASLRRTAAYCRQHGLGYRPHTKTHKSPVIGAAQLVAGATGLTVATLCEAEVMAEVCDDLLLAYPQVGAAKLARLMRLAGRVRRLSVALDSPDALAALAAAAEASGQSVGVMIEWDAGMGRVGVQTPADAVALGRAAAGARRLRYGGLMFYPGHIREGGEDGKRALGVVRTRLAEVLDALDRAGLTPATVSGGSTPTLWLSHALPMLTEVRPGTTVFNDRTTAVVGASAWDDCAYSVLATVVSTAVPGQAVIDAGSKALSKEELRGAGGGYGALLDRPDVVVTALSEEHGILDLRQTEWRPRVGDRVRVVPNHVCVSVNLQEQVWGLTESDIRCRWPVAARGRTFQSCN